MIKMIFKVCKKTVNKNSNNGVKVKCHSCHKNLKISLIKLNKGNRYHKK